MISSAIAIRGPADDAPSLVLFGRDEAGRPHAAGFGAAAAELATKAAAVMGLMILRVTDPEKLAIAEKLPRGRVFSSGRAFTPFVSAATYAKLVEMAGDAEGRKPQGASVLQNETTPSGARETGKVVGLVQASGGRRAGGRAKKAVAENGNSRPQAGDGAQEPDATGSPRLERLDDITIGSVVLASVDVADGWWEAVVQGQNGDTFTLRWRDFTGERPFLRRRLQLALLPPEGR